MIRRRNSFQTKTEKKKRAIALKTDFGTSQCCYKTSSPALQKAGEGDQYQGTFLKPLWNYVESNKIRTGTGALRHINPGKALHVHAVPDKGTSMDKRHINWVNSQGARCHWMNQVWKPFWHHAVEKTSFSFNMGWNSILKCSRHCSHALLFQGGRPTIGVNLY